MKTIDQLNKEIEHLHSLVDSHCLHAMQEQQEYLQVYLQFCNQICGHVADNKELNRDYIVKCIQAVDHKLEELGSKRLK